MAVVNVKGAALTNAESTPIVNNDVTLVGGRVRRIVETVEVGASDSNGSTYRIARIHSSWCVSSIKVFNDAITSGTSFDIGVYQTGANGGAVVDADAYASAVDLSSARTTAPLEAAFEARNIDKLRNKVWQDAGLTVDPRREYDLVITANTIGSSGGTVSVAVDYTID